VRKEIIGVPILTALAPRKGNRELRADKGRDVVVIRSQAWREKNAARLASRPVHPFRRNRYQINIVGRRDGALLIPHIDVYDVQYALVRRWLIPCRKGHAEWRFVSGRLVRVTPKTISCKPKRNVQGRSGIDVTRLIAVVLNQRFGQVEVFRRYFDVKVIKPIQLLEIADDAEGRLLDKQVLEENARDFGCRPPTNSRKGTQDLRILCGLSAENAALPITSRR